MSASPSLASTDFPCRDRNASERERHVIHLGEAIAELAARVHAATYELLVLLREFDACAGWNNGCLSCAHWLHWRTGIDLGAAREKVRVARALATLPRISAAMQRGALSYAKVRALTRIATPENEGRLVDLALAGTAAHVERLVRAWRRVDRLEAAQQAEQRQQHRFVTLHVDDEGMVVLRGRLTPEIGAVVQRALEAAADRLFQESAQAPIGDRIVDETTPAQRRADALGRLAECALAGGLDRGTAGDRYQVVVHVDAAGLQSAGEAEDTASNAPDDGQAVVELDDGATDVSAETSLRLACDASLVVMRHAPDGSVLDVGRRTRTIPAAIRRALIARDRRCQFPGCTARRCDGHHIRHWADGGATRLDNLVLLCRHHHRLLHEGGYYVVKDGANFIFCRGDGELIQPRNETPLAALIARAPGFISEHATAPTADDSRQRRTGSVNHLLVNRAEYRATAQN
jgi:Domain of unknown function (DUF222)/HNH endonuclease